MAENNLNASVSEHALQNGGVDDELDTQSEASSASGLQLSMLENRLETEMTKLASMVKNTVGSLQCTITSMAEQMEKKWAEIDQRIDSLASDISVLANQNVNQSSSLFDKVNQGNSNSQDGTQNTSMYQCRGDNMTSFPTPSEQNTQTRSIDLTKDNQCKGGNSSGNNAQLKQSCPNSSNDKSTEQPSWSKGNNHHFKMKPQNFDGGSDFDEFLCQFEITCEINAWKYNEKSLYLANCLTGEARSLLNELDHDGRRDYDTLIEKLKNRFGSVNRSEIYRTQLKSRTRSKGETIQELAQAIKKLVRQAYPGVNKDVIETLSLDNFIDAITDSDIRMRVRELSPKSLEEAEQICVRLEAYKIADKQRSRLVGRIDSEVESSKGDQNKSGQFEILSEAISSLSDEVKQFSQKNPTSTNSNSNNQRFNNNRNPRYNNRNQRYNRNKNQRYNNTNQRFDRSYRNDRNRSTTNGEHNSAYQYRGNNSDQTNQDSNNNYSSQNDSNTNNQGLQNTTYSNSNDQGFSSSRDNTSSGNLNRSGWRATTRQH